MIMIVQFQNNKNKICYCHPRVIINFINNFNFVVLVSIDIIVLITSTLLPVLLLQIVPVLIKELTRKQSLLLTSILWKTTKQQNQEQYEHSSWYRNNHHHSNFFYVSSFMVNNNNNRIRTINRVSTCSRNRNIYTSTLNEFIPTFGITKIKRESDIIIRAETNYNSNNDIESSIGTLDDPSTFTTTTTTTDTIKILIIGGGWAGYSVADSLINACCRTPTTKNIQITIVDAANAMGGLASGWKKENNQDNNKQQQQQQQQQQQPIDQEQLQQQKQIINKKSVEIGIHGFWREYRNVYDIIENSIQLSIDDILTPYIPSVLYSSTGGKVAIAPVFGTGNTIIQDSTTTGSTADSSKRTIDTITTIAQSIINIIRTVTTTVVTNFIPNIFQTNPKINIEQQIDTIIRTELYNSNIASILPSPLNVALLSNYTTSSLTFMDRLSALSLLDVWVDFDPSNRSSWYNKYDSISAETLFTTTSITSNIYNNLIIPLLHVLPMTTSYDCSAAAAISCFHVFALQSYGAFDVRWCRGTISDKIFIPWKHILIQRCCNELGTTGSSASDIDRTTSSTDNNTNSKKCTIQFQSNTKVINIEQQLQNDGDNRSISSSSIGGSTRNDSKNIPSFAVTTVVGTNNRNESSTTTQKTEQYNAVVLAVGMTGAKRLVESCIVLQHMSITKNWYKLKGITCIAVRLYFNGSIPIDISNAMIDSPVAVVGPKINNIPALVETGFCIYNLQQLQDEYNIDNTNTTNNNNKISAIEVDYFRADLFVNWSDHDIVQLTYTAIAKTLQLSTDQIDTSNIIDTSITRARNAVSHFNVNSATNIGFDGVRLTSSPSSPASSSSLSSSLPSNNIGLYAAGDWIDRTGHSSWSTEKSVVTGRQVAIAILDDFNILVGNNSNNNKINAEDIVTVIPPPSDTPQLASLRQVAKVIRSFNNKQ